MLENLRDQQRAAIAWLLGGLPLVVSSLQSVSALSGNSTLYWIPVIGGVAEALTSLPVVKQAAIIFYGQTTVILLLFLLITVAWIVQGVLMFSKIGRKKSYSKTGSAGAVVLSGILYAFLFLGIYSALFATSVGIAQIMGFFLIPVLATGSLGAAYWTYSWKDQRRAESIGRIKSAERKAKSQRRSMEADLERLPLAKVERISPDVVQEATEVKEQFFQDCDSIVEEAEEALEHSNTASVSALEKTSTSLKQRAEALDVNRAVSDLEEILRRALDNVVRDRFGDVRAEFTSTYGERYKTANLSEELRTVDIAGIDEKIVISTASKDSIAEQLHNVISHNELPLVEAIELLDTVDSKIHEELLPHLDEYEAEFHKTENRVKDNLQNAGEKIEDIGGHTGTALDRIFVKATENEKTSSTEDIRKKLDEGRQKLHACELEGALDDVQEAESMSEEYMETVQFIRSVLIPGIEREKERVSSVPHPGTRNHDLFTESLVAKLEEPIRNDFGADIDMDLSKSEITIAYDIDSEVTEETVRDQPENTGPRDEVKYLIREFQSSVGQGNVPSEGTIGIDSLPSSVKKSNPVPEFVEFVESIDDLEIVNYPADSENGDSTNDEPVQTTGYISIASAEREPINRIVDDLLDEYRTWANQTKSGR